MTNARAFPRYPVLVPTKGRYGKSQALTIRALLRDEVPFYAVVEEPEVEQYAALVGGESRLIVLPFVNRGLVAARNFIMEWTIERGFDRHWQLDDNMSGFYRFYRGKRLYCHAGVALRCVEDFTDRYENIAISGLNYAMFGISNPKPYVVNCHVYSCTLINNAIPYRWRSLYNDDTDLCLQVLADGWCTVLVNVFLALKAGTMTIRGGNTDDLYQADGRLRMARSLERLWPGVVTTRRRFGRPQHVVHSAWRKFDTPLRLKPEVDLSALPAVDEYGMKLVSKAPVVSPRLRRIMDGAPGNPVG